MTERLYYTDAYLAAFTATVLSVDAATGRVTLDRTAFYPTSGGQPHDTGVLNDIRVIDVLDEDQHIVHILEHTRGLEAGQRVPGLIDVARRTDYMQQHTGQHLLSALCADGYGWPTVSVHFGDDYCTIDVTADAIAPETLRELEMVANSRITENGDVTVSFEDPSLVAGLRKASARSGMLRVITIHGLDRSACGGTHVRRTGEIGCISLRRAERSKGAMRIEFLCGQRAVRRARVDHELLTRTARSLSASVDEVPALVELQQSRLAESDRERKRVTLELAQYEARARWEAATVNSSGLRHIHIETGNNAVRDVEPLAQALIAIGGCIVLASGSASLGIMLATSADTGLNAGTMLKTALAANGGRGGGSPRVAQGSVADAAAAQAVATALGF